MTNFALVHGGSHGAWCWDAVVPELVRLGHTAVAADVPMDRAELDLAGCADLVAAQCTGMHDPVVVGHSIAGAFLPLVAARTSARLMVFLCAMVPVEGRSLADQQAEDPSMVRFPYQLVVDEQGRTLATREIAAAMYYSDCTDDQVDRAVARLRPQAPTVRRDVFPPAGWPDVPSAYVVAAEDAVVSPDWARRAARERLGVEAVSLPGGHSPMVSRPGELAALLSELARGPAQAGPSADLMRPGRRPPC